MAHRAPDWAIKAAWRKIASGGIDWQKSSGTGTRLGVEVQVSGRSDMLGVDIMHLKDEINKGRIDAGLIIVPNDSLSKFLTDRTPNLATAIKHVQDKARDMPIGIVAFGHDGVGTPLERFPIKPTRLVIAARRLDARGSKPAATAALRSLDGFVPSDRLRGS
jgi:hypothetical protein